MKAQRPGRRAGRGSLRPDGNVTLQRVVRSAPPRFAPQASARFASFGTSWPVSSTQKTRGRHDDRNPVLCKVTGDGFGGAPGKNRTRPDAGVESGSAHGDLA